MSIGARLKLIRDKLNLTAKDFADILDIPVRTIGGYERNENPPNEKFLRKLIEKLHINVNWLLTGSGSIFNDNLDILQALMQTFDMSEKQADELLVALKNEAAKEIILKFLKAKNGDKVAIETLIQNLIGIKAVFP